MAARAKIGTAVLVLIVLLVLAGTVARLWLIALATPQHMGMAPAILNGDQVVVWRIGEPALGDVVLYERPGEGERKGIGRVIGIGPTKVDLAPGGMPSSVGGVPVKRVYLDPKSGAASDVAVAASDIPGVREAMLETLPGGRAFKIYVPDIGGKGKAFAPRTEDVPAGFVFVLNDNRGAPEADSRTLGSIERARLVGVAHWFASAGPYSTDTHAPGFLDPVL